MLMLRKIFIPRACKMLWLFFAFAVATDDLAAQSAILSAPPAFNQTLSNEDPGDVENHAWKLFKSMSGAKHDAHSQNLAIRACRDQANGTSIPASPAIFFKPDRAPPSASQ